MAAQLVEAVKSTYHLSLSCDYVERVLNQQPNITAQEVYRRGLQEHLADICSTTAALPYGIASQPSTSFTESVVLQISTARDATQPLRPCADNTEEEALLLAANQRSGNPKRLLRLTLTDGHSEIPALELTTLRRFTSIPIPGEKILIKKGAEVRNGAILLQEESIELLGGEVTHLKKEYLAQRRRAETGMTLTTGLSGAPQFEPLDCTRSQAGGRPAAHQDPSAMGGGGGGWGRGRGQQSHGGGRRGGGGGGNQRGGGRGYGGPPRGRGGNGPARGRGDGGRGYYGGRGGASYGAPYAAAM